MEATEAVTDDLAELLCGCFHYFSSCSSFSIIIIIVFLDPSFLRRW